MPLRKPLLSSVGAYLAKAWVNFNGTGTVAIVGSGNVSSITDNGTGDYTVNFTIPMADTLYATITSVTNTSASDYGDIKVGGTYTASAVTVTSFNNAGTAVDVSGFHVVIFR